MAATDGGVNGGVPPHWHHTSFDLEIPSDVRHIESIVDLVQRVCRELAFPARQCSLNVPVALSEALSNAILRGNQRDPSKPVRVRFNSDGDRLVVEIVDQGAGFDLQRSTRDPTRPENLTREDGRGLFLMKSLMDRIERYNQGGNVVRMVMNRHA
ncbi:MAG: ATP-binding protein [Gemmatimonadaceae bacterium]